MSSGVIAFAATSWASTAPFGSTPQTASATVLLSATPPTGVRTRSEGSCGAWPVRASPDKAGATIPERLTLDLDVSGCGTDDVALDRSSHDLTLNVRERSNGGHGIALSGASSTATDLTIANTDVRAHSILIGQTLAGDFIAAPPLCRFALGAPYGLTLSTSHVLDREPPIGGDTVTDYNHRIRCAGDFVGHGRENDLARGPRSPVSRSARTARCR
ncbi:hypothetical protein [Agromyces albus]|uniref:hypothetical protein n=1 Tax=Agromyces albus TaxID=205332 RepID=UPI00278AD2DC|nr:hypothetical protein [Agromyces albus]MDQ0574575.1 hypothetical protein [Agromyces albus]